MKVRNAAMRIIRTTRRGAITVQGHRMIIDDSPLGMGLELLVFGCYEKPETDFVMEYVGEGDTVIDVGANIGYHTLLLARKVGRSGTVYGFEPEAGNFEILRNNIDNNGYKNCTLLNKAVSDTNGGGGCMSMSSHRCIMPLTPVRIMRDIVIQSRSNASRLTRRSARGASPLSRSMSKEASTGCLRACVAYLRTTTGS